MPAPKFKFNILSFGASLPIETIILYALTAKYGYYYYELIDRAELTDDPVNVARILLRAGALIEKVTAGIARRPKIKMAVVILLDREEVFDGLVAIITA